MEQLQIRNYTLTDEKEVIDLWEKCNLIVPQNDPKKDIEEKMNYQPEMFYIGEFDHKIIASIMIGYDGHRGWIYYLAIHPQYQRKGFGSQLLDFAENIFLELGCQKINVQIRTSNSSVVEFYKSNGFSEDHVFGLGKRMRTD